MRCGHQRGIDAKHQPLPTNSRVINTTDVVVAVDATGIHGGRGSRSMIPTNSYQPLGCCQAGGEVDIAATYPNPSFAALRFGALRERWMFGWTPDSKARPIIGRTRLHRESTSIPAGSTLKR